jgi:RNA polymerase sigma factor (sigma-70 family)
MLNSGAPSSTNIGGRGFETTHWSVVWSARDRDSSSSVAARERLCRTYWPPLYHYLRRGGHSPDDAKDLTQEFLSRFLHRNGLDHLQDQRGKFRSFLLTFLKNFLSDERDRANAQKRGGGHTLISIDAYDAEEREFVGLADTLTPEQAFERQWGQAVMTGAAKRLREDYAARDKLALFEELKDLHPGEHGQRNYAQIGELLGMSEQAVKSAVLNFRRRYARALREEIAQTVLHPGEVDAELQHLKQTLANR